MKLLSVIVTTILVGTAGVIAGTLLAPDKGSRTRNRIAEKGKEYKEYLHDNFDDFVETVSHPFEKAEDEAARLSRKAEEKAKDIKNDVKHTVKNNF